MRRSIWLVFLALWTVEPRAWTQPRYHPELESATPAGIPYTRYSTLDKFQRRILFYVATDSGAARLPLVVVILGSGPFSNFRREGERIADAHGTVRRVFAGKAHVLVVEKPEVAFLEQPSHANENGLRGSLKFQTENTVPRWVEAISAALYAARKLPQVDTKRTLIIGHSEGALIAALLAGKHHFVTHVALLAGTGPPLKLELERKAREGKLYPGLDSAHQIRKLQDDLAAIRSDPASTSKVAIGHTHMYWASRLELSAMKTLSGSKAKMFVAHGTADQNVSFQNFSVMLDYLRRHKRNVTAMQVEGADHGFRIAASDAKPAYDAWGEVIAAIGTWFQP